MMVRYRYRIDRSESCEPKVDFVNRTNVSTGAGGADFLPGLSTTIIDSQVSGRGIGMFAIKEAINRDGGTIKIENRPGNGCNF